MHFLKKTLTLQFLDNSGRAELTYDKANINQNSLKHRQFIVDITHKTTYPMAGISLCDNREGKGDRVLRLDYHLHARGNKLLRNSLKAWSGS